MRQRDQESSEESHKIVSANLESSTASMMTAHRQRLEHSKVENDVVCESTEEPVTSRNYPVAVGAGSSIPFIRWGRQPL